MHRVPPHRTIELPDRPGRSWYCMQLYPQAKDQDQGTRWGISISGKIGSLLAVASCILG